MAVEKTLLDLAVIDKEVSELILGTSNDELKQNVAAYHTQQAVEKIIKHLLITKRGYGNISHDVGTLVNDAKEEGLLIPDWVDNNSYEISKWATTIRYNSNFKTNREKITELNNNINKWIEEIKKMK